MSSYEHRLFFNDYFGGKCKAGGFEHSSEMTSTKNEDTETGFSETSQETARTESCIMWAGIGLDSRLKLSTKQILSKFLAQVELRTSTKSARHWLIRLLGLLASLRGSSRNLLKARPEVRFCAVFRASDLCITCEYIPRVDAPALTF
jgi:hypothetical protein